LYLLLPNSRLSLFFLALFSPLVVVVVVIVVRTNLLPLA
jgi:hypothetical protein